MFSIGKMAVGGVQFGSRSMSERNSVMKTQQSKTDLIMKELDAGYQDQSKDDWTRYRDYIRRVLVRLELEGEL